MKKFLLIFSFTLFSLSFSSCDDDSDEAIFEHLVGRTWIGDFGLIHPSGEFVESGITFNPNGFGQDEAWFYQEQGGGPAGKFEISWTLLQSTLSVDYGNAAPPRELRNIYLWQGELSGDLYIFDDQPDPYYGRITLYME